MSFFNVYPLRLKHWNNPAPVVPGRVPPDERPRHPHDSKRAISRDAAPSTCGKNTMPSCGGGAGVESTQCGGCSQHARRPSTPHPAPQAQDAASISWRRPATMYVLWKEPNAFFFNLNCFSLIEHNRRAERINAFGQICELILCLLYLLISPCVTLRGPKRTFQIIIIRFSPKCV